MLNVEKWCECVSRGGVQTCVVVLMELFCDYNCWDVVDLLWRTMSTPRVGTLGLKRALFSVIVEEQGCL